MITATKSWLVVACAVGLTFVSAVPAKDAEARVTIRTTNHSGVIAMGKFYPRRDASLRSAIRAFGSPTSRRVRFGGRGCRVKWSRLGLLMEFANYGGISPGRTACDPSVGKAQTAKISGPRVRRWETARGLRGGDDVFILQDLYPNAERHGRRWWLITGYSHIGDGGYYAKFAAGVTRDLVRDFHIVIGAASE